MEEINFYIVAISRKPLSIYTQSVITKKNGAKKETKVEPTVVNKEDLYDLPMRKAVKITDKGGEVVVSGGVEEGEHYEYNIWYS